MVVFVSFSKCTNAQNAKYGWLGSICPNNLIAKCTEGLRASFALVTKQKLEFKGSHWCYSRSFPIFRDAVKQHDVALQKNERDTAYIIQAFSNRELVLKGNFT